MDIARQRVRDPRRQAIRIEQALDVPAEVLRLPRVPQIDLFALAAERFLAAPVASRPRNRQALGQLLGRDDHRAIAAEMARFV